MKIIAKSKHGFLVEATDNELARIAGHNSAYAMEQKHRLEIGHTVDVNAMFDALVFERQRPDALTETAKRLRAEADKIDKINAALLSPIVKESSPQ